MFYELKIGCLDVEEIFSKFVMFLSVAGLQMRGVRRVSLNWPWRPKGTNSFVAEKLVILNKQEIWKTLRQQTAKVATLYLVQQ